MSNELIVTVEENKFVLEIETTVDNTANKIDIDFKNHDVVEISTSNPVSGGGGSALTQEQVQDYVAGLLTGTSGISADYQDITNNLSISVTGINSNQINNFNSAVDARVTVASISPEEIMDVVGGVSGIYGVSGISVNYKDTDDRLDIGINEITESQIVDLQSYLTSFTETNDLSSAVIWADVPDGNITDSSVTQHSGALQITESQVVDLQNYLTSHPIISNAASDSDNSGSTFIQDILVDSYGHVTGIGTGVATGGGSEINDLSSSVTWANVPDNYITETSVTQHSGALQITESQITDLQTYLTSFTETNDLSSAVTWANVPDANITESSVTQHSGALQITESQVVDLQSYLTSESNDLSSAVTWANVPDTNITESSVVQHSGALLITESQITDLQPYLTSYTETDTLTDVTSRGNTTTTTCVIPFYYGNQAAFPNATTYHGAIAHSHSDAAMYFAHGGVWNKLANTSDISNSANWDTAYTTVNNSGNAWTQAYNWGDHGSQGYLTDHPSISAASSSDNSPRTYIQDILLDSNGHVTGIAVATETVTDTDTTYIAGSGLQLNGTTFDALTATVSSSGITTLSNTINTDQDKALTPKSINDAVTDGTIHPNIAGATTSNTNSGNTFLQNIAFDTNGHVTSVSVGTASEGDGGGGLSSVLADGNPQLGGDLDLNSFAVSGQGSVDINGSGIFSLNVVATGMGIGIEQPNTVGNEAGLHIADRNYPELHFTNDSTGHSNTDGANIQLNGTRLITTNRQASSYVQFYTFDASSVTKQRLGLGPTQSVFNAAYDDNDFLVYGTGTTPVIHVDAFNERLGIGNSSPVHALDVVGTGRFVHADGHCGLIIEDAGGSGLHIGDCAGHGSNGTYTGMKHSDHTSADEYMILTDGTSTLIGGKTGSTTYLRSGGNGQTYQAQVASSYFGVGTSDGNRLNIDNETVTLNKGTGNYDFKVMPYNNENPIIHCDADSGSYGRLGIGRSPDNYIVDVSGSMRINPLSAATLSLTVNRNANCPSIVSEGDTTENQWLILDSSGNACALNYFSSNDVLLAYGGGNIGIGRSTTTRKVTVKGNSSDNTAAILIQPDGLGSTTTDGLLLSQNNAGLGYLWNFENNGLAFATNALERMRIDTEGKVGIGTSVPGTRLDVRNGDILVGTKLLVGSGIYSQTSPGAYFGLKHTSLTGPSEYMIMSAGTHTYISAKEDSDVYIRGGGNKVDHQIVVTESGITLGKNRPAASSVDAEHDVELVYDDGGCVRIADRGGSGIMIGDCANAASDIYAGIKHTSMAGSNDYMIISSGTDTFISAASDNHVFIRGGGNSAESQISVLDVAAGSVGIVLNENGSDRDVRMEGTGNTNLFRLDASEDRIGIGTSSPETTLHISGSGDASIVNMTVSSGSWAGLLIRDSDDINVGGLQFGNSGVVDTHPDLNRAVFGGSRESGVPFLLYQGRDAGELAFKENNKRVVLDSDGNTILTAASSKNVFVSGVNLGINTISPSYKLDVAGTFSADSININEAFTFPTSDGTAEQSLVTDGAGNVTWSGISSGGLSNVSEDTNPQLGGNLDLNSKNINGNGNISNTGIIKVTHTDGACGLMVEDTAGSGVHVGDCAYSAGDHYAGMKHTNHTDSQEYMIISAGHSTVVSSKAGTSTYIRAGGNATAYQGIFGPNAFGIGPSGNKFRVNSQAAIVNHGTGNLDFKVYAQDEAVPLIHADAALNKVGIGTSTPAKKLHVVGDLLIDDGSAIVFDTNGLKITDDTVGATLDTNIDDALVIGEGSKSYADKSINIANGRFSSDGDSQKILQVLRGSTTNANLFYLSNTGSTAELLMNGSDLALPGTAFNVDGILLPSSAVFTFTIHVSCRKQSSDDSAAWIIRGAVRNSKGWADGDVGSIVGASNISSTMNYHLIGSPIVESYIDPALAGVTAEVTTSYYNPHSTNTINNAWFGIQTNGLSSTNLRWSATVEGVLTTY